MGHYRSALSNWLHGRRRPREIGDATKSGGVEPPLPPPTRLSVADATSGNLRHMRSFEVVGAAAHKSADKSRRSTWAASQAADATAATAPPQQQQEHRLSLRRRLHLGRHIPRRLSKQQEEEAPVGSVHSPDMALTPGPAPSIIFIEC